MKDSPKQQTLFEFIVVNIPYAIHLNPSCKYSNEEYQKAQEILEADLKYFKEQDHTFISQAFACLLRSISLNLKELEKWSEQEFRDKGDTWKHYHKMIPEFNRVMQSFYNPKYEGKLKNGGEVFPITEVIFKGSKTNQKIVLEGPILEIIRSMFFSFNRVYSKEDKEKMQNFSLDLYQKYETFMLQWQILISDSGTIARQLIKNREEDSKEGATNTYKYAIANNINNALSKLTVKKSRAKYPSINKRIIGKLLNEVGLFSYNGWIDDKYIENFIRRGNPELLGNTTRTEKPKK